MDITAELFSKWQGWIQKDLLRQFQNIFILKSVADGFEASLQPYVGTAPEWSDLVEWMSVNYIGNTASAIRRLDDHRQDTISLRRLLEDLKKHADVITPDNLAKYCKFEWPPGMPAKMTVEEAVAYDLDLLTEHGGCIRRFVNKMVAHHADDAHKITIPTYGDFRNAMHIFHCVYRKWALLLAGMGCQLENPNPYDLLPNDPPDYKEYFAKMWDSVSG
jgi:hypothetical protein